MRPRPTKADRIGRSYGVKLMVHSFLFSGVLGRRPLDWVTGLCDLAHQQSESPPAPETVDLGQTGGPHPAQLRLDAHQFVLWVVGRPPDGRQERSVEFWGGRCHHLEVGVEPARKERLGYFGQQALFALILQMVD